MISKIGLIDASYIEMVFMCHLMTRELSSKGFQNTKQYKCHIHDDHNSNQQCHLHRFDYGHFYLICLPISQYHSIVLNYWTMNDGSEHSGPQNGIHYIYDGCSWTQFNSNWRYRTFEQQQKILINENRIKFDYVR